MSVDFGTLTLRSVHPASPALLRLFQKGFIPLPTDLELQHSFCRPALAGASTFLKQTRLFLYKYIETPCSPTPFRTLPRTASQGLSRIEIVLIHPSHKD